MDYNKIIIECSSDKSPWKLMRYSGDGTWFYIGCDNMPDTINLPLFNFSMNYFKCRSMAIKIYKVFLETL